MRPRRPHRQRPRRAGGREREREVATIAREAALGWRERVFTYLFDPSWSVRNEASEWLLDGPDLNRAEHAHVLRDREWAVRYNAASRRLADPECETVPDWVPDLFADALTRERNAIVARQIMLLLALWAPERFPRELPSRICENRGYARAGFALGLLRIGETRGWDILRAMLAEDEFILGMFFVLHVLTGEDRVWVREGPNDHERAYVQALIEWSERDIAYPHFKTSSAPYVAMMRACTARL